MSKSYTELAIWPPTADVVRVAGRRPTIPHRPIDAKPGTADTGEGAERIHAADRVLAWA